MAAPSPKSGLRATPPTFALHGEHDSLFMVMTKLGANPASGRLLRGLTPYLDEHGARHVFLFTERRRREPWSSDGERVVRYQELLHWERGPGGGVYEGVCTRDNLLKQEEVIQAFEYEPLHLIEWAARRMDAAVVTSNLPMRLGTAEVPKPWGREIWYTGIEERGVSSVRDTSGGETALPYALGMFPVPIVGEKEVPPILLKVLEPHADAVFGDLYLEVHREKWEVYVVLQVDETAWPDGIGSLRAGLHPEVVERYHQQHGSRWEAALEGDLANAIKAYEEVRRAIDDRIAEHLREREFDPDAPVPPDEYRRAQESLASDLLTEERRRREAVEAFLGSVPLQPGDVVTLPPGVLHSLQHGVTVLEFQTPTYERLIALFAQKVLTQPHWDTEEAIRAMHKDVFASQVPEPIEEEEGIRVERVVEFPQFQVQRLRLDLNRTLTQRTDGNNQYRLLFVTEGKGELLLPKGATYPLETGSVYLLPAAMGEYKVTGIAAQGVSYLQAIPNLEAVEDPEPTDEVEDRIEKIW